MPKWDLPFLAKTKRIFVKWVDQMTMTKIHFTIFDGLKMTITLKYSNDYYTCDVKKNKVCTLNCWSKRARISLESLFLNTKGQSHTFVRYENFQRGDGKKRESAQILHHIDKKYLAHRINLFKLLIIFHSCHMVKVHKKKKRLL